MGPPYALMTGSGNPHDPITMIVDGRSIAYCGPIYCDDASDNLPLHGRQDVGWTGKRWNFDFLDVGTGNPLNNGHMAIMQVHRIIDEEPSTTEDWTFAGAVGDASVHCATLIFKRYQVTHYQNEGAPQN